MNETEFECITRKLDALAVSLHGKKREQLETVVETIRAIHWNVDLFELTDYIEEAA